MIPLPDLLVRVVLALTAAVAIASAVAVVAVGLGSLVADYLSRRAKRSAEERR